jgi:hypothetical protein
MKLLAVGDSFTYGDELSNLTNAWPYLLGGIIDYEVTNLGIPSGGNTQMIRKVIENYNDYDLIVVAWTHFARTEFSDSNGTYDIWPGCYNKLFVNNLEYRKKLIEYLTRYHNDQYLYKQYLLNIILLQHFLKQNNKRYIMLDAFSNNRYRNLDSTLTIDSTNYLGWPNESMMEWTYGCTKGPNGHFLEDGHKRVAEKINEHIRNLSWVS